MNLGSSVRGDGQWGMNAQNWGAGSPAANVPADNFAMHAYTRINLTAGNKYKVWLRSDDGYRMWAHKLGGNAQPITDNALGGTFLSDAYGGKEFTFVAQEGGTFDFHVQMAEGGGDAYFDLVVTDVTAPPPNQIMDYQYFVNNWQNWSWYTSQNPFVNSYWYNGVFYDGNCTWYAHGRMLQLGYSEYALDSMLKNAGEWDNYAARGCSVTYTPQVGSIAVWEAGVNGAGDVGHVAVVESINGDGTITISESNWGTPRRYRTRNIAANNPSKFIIVPKA
ncbi:MAG: CHAP domain-containing protein [Cuspidothrix sp.]